MANVTNSLDCPAFYPRGGSYADFLAWHLEYWGTRETGNTAEKGEPWDLKDFIVKAFAADANAQNSARVGLRNWLATAIPPNSSPNEVNNSLIQNALFGNNSKFDEWRKDLNDARERCTEGRNRRTKEFPKPTSPGSTPTTHVSDVLVRNDNFARVLDIDLNFRNDNAFLFIPEYPPSHKFIGRFAELQTLGRWADDERAPPFLVLNAIGGTGKSYLTWEWLRRSTGQSDARWHGRFWFSFYEPGATLSMFLRCLLAFMSGRGFNDFSDYSDRALSLIILEQLKTSPWLIVMDGMERLLVRYNRLDAANQRDNFRRESNSNGSSDDCLTIRPQDADILRALASAQPSKILASSRLIPSCLLNAAGQPVPGVDVIDLPGLERADAVAFFHECGVTGADRPIGTFLEANCGNHPMVIGALAGLIVNDIQCAGNFDMWLKFNQRRLKAVFQEMDLIQRKNHILEAALAGLSPMSRRLLSVLASVSGGVGIEALKAFNPHAFEVDDHGSDISPTDIDQIEVMKRLSGTVNDLRIRGLIQVSADRKIYDLHPVIRGCVYELVNPVDKSFADKRVIDHFTSVSTRPFAEVTTMEALRPGLEIFHAMVRVGDVNAAFKYFHKNLCDPLLFNLEEHHRCLGMLSVFSSSSSLRTSLDKENECSFFNIIGICSSWISSCDDTKSYFSAAIQNAIDYKLISGLICYLTNYITILWDDGDLKLAMHYIECLLKLRDPWATNIDKFCLLHLGYDYLTKSGALAAASLYWQELDPMGRDWPVSRYRQGGAEIDHIIWHYRNGTLTDEHIASAEQLTHSHAASRYERRRFSRVRGFIDMSRGSLRTSRDHFANAVQAAREMDLHDGVAEAKYLELSHLIGEGLSLSEMQSRIQALLQNENCSKIDIAELCRAIGDDKLALKLSRELIDKIDGQGDFFDRHEDRIRALAIINDR